MVVVLLALIAPLVCERIGIPIVVGEIIFGLAVGLSYTVYTYLTDQPMPEWGEPLTFFSLVGLLFLLFLAGMEIDLNIIFSQGLKTILKAVILFELTVIFSFLAVSLINLGENTFFLALVLSTTSVGVVVPTLRETRSTKTSTGQTILLSAIFADFATMTLLMVYTIERSFPTGGGANVAPLPVLFLVFLFALFIAIYLVGRAAIWHFPKTLSRFFRMDDPTEIGVRASIAILFIFVAISGMLATEAAESIAILGAFLAGVVITMIFPHRKLLEKQLFGLGYGFFIPFFFIYLGLTFDFVSMTESYSLFIFIPLLLLIAYLVKMIPSLIFLQDYPTRETLGIGILLAARLSLIIAAAEIGYEMGLIDSPLRSAIILVGVITSVLSPILFRKIFPEVKD